MKLIRPVVFARRIEMPIVVTTENWLHDFVLSVILRHEHDCRRFEKENL
jgi:hypothetical protein